MSTQLSPVTPLREELAEPISRVLAPRSQVKVRRLSRTFEPRNFLKAELIMLVSRLGPRSSLPLASPFEQPEIAELTAGHRSGLTGLVSNPRDVHAREQRVEFQQARQWVRSGRLKLSDLIDVGRGWESVGDCVELTDEVDLALTRSAWRNRLIVAALVVANILWPLLFLYGSSRVLPLLP